MLLVCGTANERRSGSAFERRSAHPSELFKGSRRLEEAGGAHRNPLVAMCLSRPGAALQITWPSQLWRF